MIFIGISHYAILHQSILYVCTPLYCFYLVPQVRVCPSSKEQLYHFMVALEAGYMQCCHTILQDRMQPHKVALVQLLLKTPPLDKLSGYITVVAYSTNYQPIPTFQTVEGFNINIGQFYKCVASKQCLLPVNPLHSQQRYFCIDWSYTLSNQQRKVEQFWQEL